MKFLDEALVYRSMGWGVYPAHSISMEGVCTCGRIDCPTPGKHPVGRWMEYQNRLPTMHEVKLWFSNLDCNIGTITGRVSGMVVVDVDGNKGLKSLATLDLTPTLQARTGGGGLHLFYSCDQ